MYERLEYDVWSPSEQFAQSYRLNVFIDVSRDYSSTYAITLLEGEGPRGERLNWGDCTDTDAGGWPDWAHESIVRHIANSYDL
jgi:hypothetical protein